jgi:hypothetical protein
MEFGNIILVLLMFSIVAVLVGGVVLMAIGGKANAKYAHTLMVARVSLQGLVLLVLVLMFMMGNK